MTDRCPACFAPVTIAAGREGTHSYAPVEKRGEAPETSCAVCGTEGRALRDDEGYRLDLLITRYVYGADIDPTRTRGLWLMSFWSTDDDAAMDLARKLHADHGWTITVDIGPAVEVRICDHDGDRCVIGEGSHAESLAWAICEAAIAALDVLPMTPTQWAASKLASAK